MCGIAGIFYKKKIRARAVLERMLDRLVHRGPDGVGYFEAENIALGMRRLSIIDLEGGWQPIYSEDKRLALLMNGEIYNYVELREELQQKGHIFSTGSDAEVIVHLFEENGIDCISRLRGMFAFVIYDSLTRTAFLARDRMGEKPLYLYETSEFFIFSSEMKSLLSTGVVPFALDPSSVNDYFHYQYVPEPKTPLKDVRKLPRAHYIEFSLSDWKLKEFQYWDLEEVPAVTGNPAELVRNELETVCDLLLRSDVPVGVALSGGIDSSAIAALASRKYSGSMHAFSVGYPGRPDNDERNNAKALANALSMPFHEIELHTQELVSSFQSMNFHRDDPIADISGFGYFSVNKAAREAGIPVLLQGQGGDEIFWGYQWVMDAAKATAERDSRNQKNTTRKRAFSNRFEKLLNYFTGRDQLPTHQFRPIFHELAPDFEIALSSAKDYYSSEFIDSLGTSSAFDFFTFDKKWIQSDILITRLICDTYLLENGIAQGDRLSMANSVELRLPFVDYKLVELIIGLRKTYHENPDYLKFPKPWLREALKDVLPVEILNRPKQGFAPPVHDWHRAIFKTYGNLLIDGFLVRAGVLSKEGARELAAGPFPRGAIAPMSFKALVLEMWCRSMSEISTQKQSV